MNATTWLLLLDILLIFAVYLLYNDNKRLRFANKSAFVRFGKYTEQFMAVLSSYPYDKNNFRFIGSPIDGVQFEPDKIIFVEFKTGEAQLSDRQILVRQLVEGGKVEWKEIRIPPTR